MKKLLIIGVLLTLVLTTGCGQYAAKNLGGTSEERLPENTKLINATWKGTNLWILTRPMQAQETAETYEFRESSVFGVMEGKVVIKETKE